MATKLWLNSGAVWGIHQPSKTPYRSYTPTEGQYPLLLLRADPKAVSSGSAWQTTGLPVGPRTDPGVNVYTSSAKAVGFTTHRFADSGTISGSINYDYYLGLSNAATNNTVRMVIYKLSVDGGTWTQVHDHLLGTAITTGPAHYTGSFTPTSFSYSAGERLLFLPFWEDATSLTGNSGSIDFYYGSGYNSFLEFTENLTFGWPVSGDVAAEPATPAHKMWLTSNAAGSITNGKLLSSTVSGTATDYTVNAPTYPNTANWTDTAGGSEIAWYSNPVAADHTLKSRWTLYARGGASGATILAAVTVWIYKCDGDGSNPVLISQAHGNNNLYAAFSQAYGSVDASLVTGQRLKVVLKATSSLNSALPGGGTAYVTGSGATNTSYLAFYDDELITTEAVPLKVTGAGSVSATATVTGDNRYYILPGSPLSPTVFSPWVVRPAYSPQDQNTANMIDNSNWAGYGKYGFLVMDQQNRDAHSSQTSVITGPVAAGTLGLIARQSTNGGMVVWITPPL